MMRKRRRRIALWLALLATVLCMGGCGTRREAVPGGSGGAGSTVQETQRQPQSQQETREQTQEQEPQAGQASGQGTQEQPQEQEPQSQRETREQAQEQGLQSGQETQEQPQEQQTGQASWQEIQEQLQPQEQEPQSGQETVEESAAEALDPSGSYTSCEEVALYLQTYGKLPGNFITKAKAKELGWEGGSLEPYAPGMCIGGDKFGNYEGKLPKAKGRIYHECDIDTLGAKSRGAKRIVYSNDGLIYYTKDHYENFTLLYGDEED